jgi:hypothetical protein
MDISRRSWLGVMAALPFSAAAGDSPRPGALVGREEFPLDGIYINAAYTHPLPVRSARAVESYLLRCNSITRQSTLPEAPAARKTACERFAKLINARPEEVILVPSTTYARITLPAGCGWAGAAPRWSPTSCISKDRCIYMPAWPRAE